MASLCGRSSRKKGSQSAILGLTIKVNFWNYFQNCQACSTMLENAWQLLDLGFKLFCGPASFFPYRYKNDGAKCNPAWKHFFLSLCILLLNHKKVDDERVELDLEKRKKFTSLDLLSMAMTCYYVIWKPAPKEIWICLSHISLP